MESQKTVQSTLILIKPDGIKKSLTGNVLSKLSEAKFHIIAARVVKVSQDLAREHYKELHDKPFFNDLIKYIQGAHHGKDYARVMALVYRGENAIKTVRALAGATNPEEADPTTIRGAYGRITTKGIYENVIHASANEEDAEREIKLWFKPDEIVIDLFPSKPVSHTVDEREWC